MPAPGPPPVSDPNGEFDTAGLPAPTSVDEISEVLDASAPRSAESAVTGRLGDYAFPLGLAVLIIVFLVVQHRLDAGDPKLAEDGAAEAPPLSFNRRSRVT